jgi:hypothetical protein
MLPAIPLRHAPASDLKAFGAVTQGLSSVWSWPQTEAGTAERPGHGAQEINRGAPAAQDLHFRLRYCTFKCYTCRVLFIRADGRVSGWSVSAAEMAAIASAEQSPTSQPSQVGCSSFAAHGRGHVIGPHCRNACRQVQWEAPRLLQSSTESPSSAPTRVTLSSRGRSK